ncbi:MAG: DUF192 domain-containing protein [Acidimicrobiales bacterium]
MRSGWLLRDGDVVCALEMTETIGERTRGLLGRDGCDGAMHLSGTRSVLTVGMRFPLDVALLSEDLTVLATRRVAPWRVVLPRRGVRSVVEAEAGSWERWGVRVGDQLVIREVQ